MKPRVKLWKNYIQRPQSVKIQITKRKSKITSVLKGRILLFGARLIL